MRLSKCSTAAVVGVYFIMVVVEVCLWVISVSWHRLCFTAYIKGPAPALEVDHMLCLSWQLAEWLIKGVHALPVSHDITPESRLQQIDCSCGQTGVF